MGTLRIAKVGAPAINCIFDPSCKVVVEDTTDKIAIPAGGTNFLQSRTFQGKAAAPAAGLFAYEYRIDLREALGITYVPCVNSLMIDFGPVYGWLDYNGDGVKEQVYVVTTGGLGSIGLASAVQDGDTIVFTFASPVCAGASKGKGDSTFFFGLVSAKPPAPTTATVTESLSGQKYTVKARSPKKD